MRWLAPIIEPLWLAVDRRLPLGRRGENAAARHLQRLGYVIVARGHRGLIGEIDLVAVEGRTLVFVEVKTRTSQDAGHPADAVDAAKQRRLTRLALSYMKRHDLLDNPARFDVIAVTWPDQGSRPVIEHFKDAFEPVGFEGMFS
ncbi:MAG TPA: YraN family protein, partial [Pirellulaceae bacterium]|nr:YraN family protein [Pirellulaceae bacterium]